jgi:hypothetical protein
MRRSHAAKTFPGSGPRFAAVVYRTAISQKLDAGLSLQRIWQDLVEGDGDGASYESVKRVVRTRAPAPGRLRSWRADAGCGHGRRAPPPACSVLSLHHAKGRGLTHEYVRVYLR